MKIRIVDRRTKEKFLMDDLYLNGQAKICGWQATLVYVSLCRHVNKNQESFPSVRLLSEEVAVSRPTIIKGLKNLEKYNVIQIKKMRTKDGRWLNNTYVLLDKSVWERSQVNEVDTNSQVNESKDPSKRELTPKSTRVNSQVNEVDTKETHRRKHIEGNTLKETHRGKRFSPPTQQEVTKYCKERNNGVDAERWRNFYQARGWLLGKNKMKDWKACVRTWERKQKPKKGGLDEWLTEDK